MKDFMLREQAPDAVADPNQLVGTSGTLINLVRDIADVLERNYAGWLWAVQPYEGGGIIKIFSLLISGQYGYIMKIEDIQNDPERKLAVEAGGNILERYSLPRGPYKKGLLDGKMRDLVGNLVPDITDKDGREQKRDRDRKITEAVNEGVLQLRTVDHEQADGSVYREVHMKIGDDDEK